MKNKRRIKLIDPRLQLRLIATFAGIATLALLAQFLLLGRDLSRLAADMHEGGDVLAHAVPGMLLGVFLLSFGLLLPLVFLVGVRATFRIAGPLYRFRDHLSRVVRGEDPGICRIRKDDELHDLCALINDALAAAREQGRRSALEGHHSHREAA